MILEDLSRKSHILSSRIEFIQAKGEKVYVQSKNVQSKTKVETNLPLVWKSVTAVGPGLVNMGNTCFLNSVLQCLTYIPALAQTLLRSRHKCASVSSCTLFAMEEHIKLMNHANKPVVPKSILSKLRFISKALKLGRQEDAHEFLLGLLDSMQKYCARKSDNSTVKSIFDGSIQSIVKCRVCKHESKTTDPMMDIALDIKHCHDINTAFSKYTKKELLVGGNRYFCERCKKQVDAQKQLKIQQEPPVLLIQLKRFGFMHNFGSKMNNHVAFGEELDLDPYILHNKAARYQLVGVVVHAGYTTNSGHYFSFVKNSNGVWYCMDDSNVSQVSLSTVLSQKAYMLFYSKKDMTDSQTITTAIKSFPTPPLSPAKNLSINSEKDSKSTKKTNAILESAKGGKNFVNGVTQDNIKEPKPIVSQSSKSTPSGGKIVKNLEKIAESGKINATSKTWKVSNYSKNVAREPTEGQKSSNSKLLAPSLPDLMQHFSPVSVLSWNNSDSKSISSEKKRKRKDAQDILYDQGKLPKYLKRQIAQLNQVRQRR